MMPNESLTVSDETETVNRSETPVGVEQENARYRLREGGLGAELLRQLHIGELRLRMAAFYEHASLADVIGLCRVLELSDESAGSRPRHQAPLLEAMLEFLKLGSNISADD